MLKEGINPLQDSGSLTQPAREPHWQGKEMLPSISSVHFCPHTHAHRQTHREESISMRVGAFTCLWLGSPFRVFLFRQRQCETEETQWSDCAAGYVRGSAVRRTYCRWLVLFSGECGGGGSQLPLHTYGKGWKWQLWVGFMNKKGHERVAGCDTDGQPTLQFSLSHLWKENEHLRVSIKQ